MGSMACWECGEAILLRAGRALAKAGDRAASGRRRLMTSPIWARRLAKDGRPYHGLFGRGQP